MNASRLIRGLLVLLASLLLCATLSCREKDTGAAGGDASQATAQGNGSEDGQKQEATQLVTDSEVDSITGVHKSLRLEDPSAAVPKPDIAALRKEAGGLTPAEAFARLEKENVQLNLASISPRLIKGESMLGAFYVMAGGNVNELDPSGQNLPLLSLCANLGDSGLCEFLLDHKADIEIVDAFRGATPVLWAAAGGDVPTIKLLQSRGAKLQSVSREGMSALHLAAMQSKPEALAYLLEQGLDPNAIDKDGVSPLIYAARAGSVVCSKLMLDHGADVNQDEASHGFTPLLAALYMERFDVADLLLKRGADKKARMKQGQTATTIISGKCPEGGIKWLIENNFDLNAQRDDTGMTLLMLAAPLNTPEVIRMLLMNGADPRLKNKEGKTALDLALEAGLKENAALIEETLSKTKQS